jgi:hypothetical protein
MEMKVSILKHIRMILFVKAVENKRKNRKNEKVMLKMQNSVLIDINTMFYKHHPYYC